MVRWIKVLRSPKSFIVNSAFELQATPLNLINIPVKLNRDNIDGHKVYKNKTGLNKYYWVLLNAGVFDIRSYFKCIFPPVISPRFLLIRPFPTKPRTARRFRGILINALNQIDLHPARKVTASGSKSMEDGARVSISALSCVCNGNRLVH